MNSSSHPPLPPPLPPPTGDVRPLEKVVRPSYFPSIFMALACFGVLWMVSSVVPVKALLVVIFGAYLLSSIVVMIRIQAFYKSCNGLISSGNQLRDALHLIDLNMKGGYIGIVILWPMLALVTLRGQGGMLIYVSLLFVPLSLWMANIEKKFKAMEALPDRPEFTQQFQDAVSQMKNPQFGLKTTSSTPSAPHSP